MSSLVDVYAEQLASLRAERRGLEEQIAAAQRPFAGLELPDPSAATFAVTPTWSYEQETTVVDADQLAERSRAALIPEPSLAGLQADLVACEDRIRTTEKQLWAEELRRELTTGDVGEAVESLLAGEPYDEFGLSDLAEAAANLREAMTNDGAEARHVEIQPSDLAEFVKTAGSIDPSELVTHLHACVGIPDPQPVIVDPSPQAGAELMVAACTGALIDAALKLADRYAKHAELAELTKQPDDRGDGERLATDEPASELSSYLDPDERADMSEHVAGVAEKLAEGRVALAERHRDDSDASRAELLAAYDGQAEQVLAEERAREERAAEAQRRAEELEAHRREQQVQHHER
jgi:hypothetical protein